MKAIVETALALSSGGTMCRVSHHFQADVSGLPAAG